ncbi:motility associated factor glycosyltransferase family protein [Spirochaeta africana]|uniref:6-hydroxymethylpterin diphosphokinase MptE-like domain-containing protein n=1 Tax=Spirochaeta africana (strain ATCC 700263 / DSM 8902 / Z-7692) TaxID=889378 RepID=H9UH77_SPIAZ|nr:6-hydroxymethylpterin diphosphokinase MptE-like protein [Spirochaeta africana]AFG36870.1 hypothetical protein Spiaf_0776 [Spirochaeta africana DSM 8902]
MQTYTDINHRFFEQRFPGYPLGLTRDLPQGVEIIETPSGFPSARINSRLLHSSRDPVREARRIAEHTDVQPDAWLVVLGFGLGYLAQALCQRWADHRIIVVDPDPRPFLAACIAVDMSSLLQHPELTLLIGPDAPRIDSILSELHHQPVQVVAHRPSIELQAGFYSDTEQRITRVLQRRTVNHNTLKRFGKLWIRNFTANLPHNLGAVPLSTAAGRFQGVPGLLIAAGPSFDASIARLGELRERCLTVAVDTALPLCLRHGIDPDIIVVVDPQYWNTRHLDRCSTSRALVVSESSAHPRIFRELHGPFLFGESLFPLGRMLESVWGPRGALGAGGSVATSGFEVLRLLGCRTVYAIGLDLGFPDGRTHCSGSFFEERIHALGTRTSPAEHHLWRYLSDGGRIDAMDYAGRPMRTDARMQVYQQWFAMQLESDPDVELRPLSECSLAIPGAQPATHADVLAHQSKRHIIDRELSRLRSVTPDVQRNAELLQPQLAALAIQLQEVAAIATEALSHIQAAWDSPGRWTPDWLQQLDRYDASLRQHQAKDIAGFLLQEALQNIQSPPPGSHPLQGSHTLYSALLESTRLHQQLLDRQLSMPGL